jgi:hypothetical protein
MSKKRMKLGHYEFSDDAPRILLAALAILALLGLLITIEAIRMHNCNCSPLKLLHSAAIATASGTAVAHWRTDLHSRPTSTICSVFPRMSAS